MLYVGLAAKLCKMSEGETEEDNENDSPCRHKRVRAKQRLCDKMIALTGVECEDEQDGQRGPLVDTRPVLGVRSKTVVAEFLNSDIGSKSMTSFPTRNYRKA
jgi:hypothetical protein